MCVNDKKDEKQVLIFLKVYFRRALLTIGDISNVDNINKYRGEGSFEGWMHTIFVRKAAALFHKQEMVPTSYVDEIDVDQKEERVDIEGQIDIREALVVALRSLDDDDRLLFNVIAVEGYSFPEASRLFDSPQSTLKSRYYKIKQVLGEILKNRLDNRYL